MTIYFFFFTLLGFFAISPIKIEKNLLKILKFFFLFSLTIFIGLRHQVGGDWDIYLYDLKNNVKYFNLLELTYVRDFGYEFVSLISYNLGLGIYGLNFLAAIICVYALNKFSKKISDNVWLTFLISYPYLIVVVFMGYTRQGIAMAFILLSLVAIFDNKLLKYALLTFLAILFHKSASIIVPIVFLSYFQFNFKNLNIFVILLIISFFLIYPELTRITSGYFSDSSKYVSSGVYYRLFLNILAGSIFVFFYKFLKFNNKFDKLIIIILILNLLLIYFSFSYSTFVDRIIAYFTITQLVVYSRIYLIYPKYMIYINSIVILIYLSITLMWFNFSNHSSEWIPYKNLLFNY